MATLRMLFPQWQGGVNPNYVLGAELLAVIAPPSEVDEMVTVAVSKDFDAPLQTEQGVDYFAALMQQTQAASHFLKDKNPDKVITYGGDCAVSLAPFAYLANKYRENLGIIWLDAHPDIAKVGQTSHLHEMVLGNLIGEGAPSFANQIPYPLSSSKIMYAGLIEKELRPLDDGVYRHQIRYATPEDLQINSQPLLDWIEQENIEFLAVHFDLDVLTPKDFRSIYPAEPGTRVEDFPAAVGELYLDQVVRVFQDLEQQTNLVGLTIAEYLPWDAINLRKALSNISIFR